MLRADCALLAWRPGAAGWGAPGDELRTQIKPGVQIQQVRNQTNSSRGVTVS
jgi:hypothetical protein